MRRISILGATGSIGCNTLDVVRALGGREAFKVVALTGAGNIAGLAAAAREVGAEIAVTADESRLDELRARLDGSGVAAAAGAAALDEAAARPADWVMAAIVGAAGLAPTLAAARSGATIALANKECLVSAGGLFLSTARAHGARVIPVDSEHSAIFQCLDAHAGRAPARFILTASGGPFRDWPRERMRTATPAAAAAHPNWAMGMKISIDSASMFNKALEMIEARWLFGATAKNLDVVVHPQSVVHSAVAYADGSVLAQLGAPDMRTAIGYALTWPERGALPVAPLDLVALSRLDFSAPDETRFPALRLARAAMEESELAGAALNGAKEAALEAFIAGRIGFLDMAEIVETVLEASLTAAPARDLEDVYEMDGAARRLAELEITRSAA
ncbi:1-deoxy-D-xylulose-5-phosphate reductoisomerase [Pikeienuella sp. HZG-20]|uniref:1-deoxy-D-xylulose-5-phosphate reductoisomerase n=1 Tax=Paludibacillus litoralis TaxID=3133267 RepID=UPI0030EEC5F6